MPTIAGEADPTLDVGGADAAQKLAIIASLAFGVSVHESDVTYRGIGVEEDMAAGYMWYDVAAKLGDLAAQQKRDDLANKMSHDDLLSAQTLALEWLEGFEGKALHAGRIE